MPQIINTNLASLGIQRNLDSSQQAQQQTFARLSSGLRILSARDDAAGLAISTRFSTITRGLGVAIRNSSDVISLSQTAESSLESVTEALQRLRELGLQSANATNSPSDRTALNVEARQLVAEIGRVTESANFNGRNLLDGTYTASYQIGSGPGDKLDVAINRSTADRLGRGADNGLNAVGNDSAIVAGEFFINGIGVPASVAASDSGSVNNASASAIAKAAAINSVSDQTGVVADVSSNVLAGSTQVGLFTVGTVTINDVAISVSTSSSNLTGNRLGVVQAVNAVAGETGVRAIDTGSTDSGIELVAEDGRNITISYSSTGAGATGLPTAGTYQANYTLRDTQGRPEITIFNQTELGVLNPESSGIRSGTYEANLATYVTETRFAQFSANVTSLSEGAVVINDIAIGAARAEDDTASFSEPLTSSKEGSGIATAAAINRASDRTGVTATVNPVIVQGGRSFFTMPAGLTGTVWINGIETREIVGTGDRQRDHEQAIAAINEISGLTGAVASDNGISLNITTTDGRNLSIVVDHRGDTRFDAGIGMRATATGIAAANVGGSATTANNLADTTYASLTLTSAGPIDIRAGTEGDDGLIDMALQAGSHGGSDQGQFIEDTDISTIEGALQLVKSVDFALDQVNAERARLGATQSRMDQILNSLTISLENTSAANSRILDADYASESASLIGNQILQQAGTTLLAQANAQPQLVLNLLQSVQL